MMGVGLQLLILHWGESDIRPRVVINPKIKGVGKTGPHKNLRGQGRSGSRGGSTVGRRHC